jgi:hypothetical protein
MFSALPNTIIGINGMNLSKLAAVTVITLLPSISYAQNPFGSGWAVTADFGVTSHVLDVDGGYKEESGHDSSPAIGISYKFEDYWSVQFQYVDAGNADLFSAERSNINYTFATETSQLNIFGAFNSVREVGSWGLGGRLGLSKWDTTLFITGTAGQESAEFDAGSDDGISIIGGVSAFYPITENLDFTLTADWSVTEPDIEVIVGRSTEVQYSRYALGITYHF